MKEKQMNKNRDMQNLIHIYLAVTVHLLYVSLMNRVLSLLNQYVALLDADYVIAVGIQHQIYMLT